MAIKRGTPGQQRESMFFGTVIKDLGGPTCLKTTGLAGIAELPGFSQ